jgi:O-antigen ligase
MIRSSLSPRGRPQASARRFWLAVAVVGGVWLFVGHHPAVSSYESYAPWSEIDEVQASGGNVVKGMVLGLIGLLGLYFLTSNGHGLQHRIEAFRVQGAGGYGFGDTDSTRSGAVKLLSMLLGFYLLWAVVSLTWSIDPAMTARRLAVMVFCVLGMLGIGRQLSPRQWAALVLVITTTYLALGILAELAYGTFRPWAAGYRFAGTVHPNTQGAQLAFLCLSAFVLARSMPRGPHLAGLVILLAVGFIFLVLTKSRTSLAGLLLGTAIVWFSARPERSGTVPSSAGRQATRGQATTYSPISARFRIRDGAHRGFLASRKALVLVVAGFLLTAAALATSLLGGDLDEQLTDTAFLGRKEESGLLTGRIPIWEELLGYVEARPWAGYGYESFWTPQHIEEISKGMHWRFREAHSAYLDAVLSVGVIGASLLLTAVFLALARAASLFHRTGDPGHGLTLGLLGFALVSAALESGMMGMNFFTFVIGCGIVQLLPPRSQR